MDSIEINVASHQKKIAREKANRQTRFTNDVVRAINSCNTHSFSLYPTIRVAASVAIVVTGTALTEQIVYAQDPIQTPESSHRVNQRSTEMEKVFAQARNMSPDGADPTLRDTIARHSGERCKDDPHHLPQNEADRLLKNLESEQVSIKDIAKIIGVNEAGELAFRYYVIFTEGGKLYMSVIGNSDGTIFEKTNNKKLPTNVRPHRVQQEGSYKSELERISRRLSGEPCRPPNDPPPGLGDEVNIFDILKNSGPYLAVALVIAWGLERKNKNHKTRTITA